MNLKIKVSDNNIKLVADIGGTNLRIGIANQDNSVSELQVYKCSQYNGLAEIVDDYIQNQNISHLNIHACFAIACPTDSDKISMTNLPWTFLQSELKASLKLSTLLMINDYTAIAYAVPFLSATQKVSIGAGSSASFKPIAICGPGTGLGVANVAFTGETAICLSGEGGHADFAPTDETEIAILSFLLGKYAHVSYEQLLSGLGIEQIYQALCHIHEKPTQPYSAQQISEKALDNSCEICHQALSRFCKILGAFAGNLALTVASFGGVYIAGGIVPRFIEFLKQSEFRTSFESKGRFTDFNKKIATYVITESQPGILGASAYLNQQLKA